MTQHDRTALLVNDVQNDFCSGGALAVPNTEPVVSAINRYIDEAVARGITVYASRDWHPAVTTHFKAYGGPWPVHCVQGTGGAEWHPKVRLPPTAIVISKGVDPERPGYSAFDGRTSGGQSFLADLQHRGIRHLIVSGLATDYCIRYTVFDALSAGLTVTVLEDAVAGIDPDDSARALREMRERGVRVTTMSEGNALVTTDAGSSGGSQSRRA